MTSRLISAAIIITVVLTLMYFDFVWGTAESIGYSGTCLVPAALILTGLAAFELTQMIASRNPSTPQSIVVTGAVITVACSCVPAIWQSYPLDCHVGKLGWNALGLGLATAIAIVFEMIRFKSADRVIANLAYSIFVIVYIGFLISFLPALRFFHSNEIGMTALVSVLFVVKFSDAGAYFFGRLMGRHKLAPRMSPGKSIEGAVGAFITGCGMSLVFFYWVAPSLLTKNLEPSVGSCLIYGLVVTLTGMVGDLFESIIKRDFKRKDSSSWLPGLGGILDIFDSILAAAPAAYVMWVVGFMPIQ